MKVGYSGTPLARKLGIAAGACVALREAPPGYAQWLQPLPDGARLVAYPDPAASIVHAFVSERATLAAWLCEFRQALPPAVVLWISWPKKAARVPTTVSEDLIRELALPLGWVDVKVCAVSEVWSGLKLVVRKALR